MWRPTGLPRWMSRWRASTPTSWCRVAKTAWIREGGRRGTGSLPSRMNPLKSASAGDAHTEPTHHWMNCCHSSTKQRRLCAVGANWEAASLVRLGPLFTLLPRRGVLRSPDTRSFIALAYWTLAYWTGVQTLPPARLFSSWILQDHRYEILEAMAGSRSKTRHENPL